MEWLYAYDGFFIKRFQNGGQTHRVISKREAREINYGVWAKSLDVFWADA